MKRTRTRRQKDRKVFTHTADRTKAINVTTPTVMRGGYRL